MSTREERDPDILPEERDPHIADQELFGSLGEAMAQLPGGEELLAELQRRAMSASSPQEFVQDILGGEDVVRELLDETGSWPLDRHRARIVEIRAEGAELDEGDVDDAIRGIDLEYEREFHEQAVELLQDHKAATLVDLGDAEQTVAQLLQRLRQAGGMYAVANVLDDLKD
jgi:hypothetical protein